MKFLFCCEYYHPSRGGVQEVMRQIAEHLVQRGHEVTVATTRLAERESKMLNGVHIEEFDVSGNFVSGMRGEIERYRAFLTESPADAVLVKAAQQWTFDASWPVLDKIQARKIFIPCGFSGLYLPQFASYFEAMPAILRKFDQLIFYAECYRDIDFARTHGITNFSILSNGASEKEFSAAVDKNFRKTFGIPEKDLLLLTVGTPINAKGHLEVVQAFSKLDLKGRTASLILNGQWPQPSPVQDTEPPPLEPDASVVQIKTIPVKPYRPHLLQRGYTHLRRGGLLMFFRIFSVWVSARLQGSRSSFISVIRKIWRGILVNAVLFLRLLKLKIKMPAKLPAVSIDDWIEEASAQRGKSIFKTNLPRSELVQAFLNADLFVFASHIEYSPLVLFEAAAAGTPFLTVPAGNAEEIIAKTKGGILCPAEKDRFGYVRTDLAVLAENIEKLMADESLRQSLGEAGRLAWREKYNWATIAKDYEVILTGASDLAKAS